MSQGYDKFFKDARKASGNGAKNGGNNGGFDRNSKPSKGRGDQFRLKAEREREPAANGRGKKLPAMTPEDRVRAELARRLAEKKQARVKKRQPFPIGAAIVVVTALVGSGVGYLYPSSIDFVLKHVEIGAFGKAEAKEDAKAKAPSASAPAGEKKPAGNTAGNASGNAANSAASEAAAGEKVAETEVASKEGAVPNIKNWTPEELSFFNKLNDRKKELDLREAELAKLEEELHKQKTALDEKIKQLEKMRSEISATLKTRVANDQEKVDKLVQFYSNMKPQQAAKVIETINEDLAIEVLDKMKKKNAAEIMNMMDAKKAQRLSELLTGYQRSPASSDAGAVTAEETNEQHAN